ncbi:MAG: hypothetical protein QOI54_3720 [Actinomycetota bacterium]|jgi:uncharacterized protein GlcG (DUF336 family)|nr:hypothetical protein [Actinomycetota bacterium]
MAMSIEVRTIGTETAQKVVAGAVEHATALGIAVCVAVVDRSGHLVAFLRMDGSPLLSTRLAEDKAYTAVSFGLPTDRWWDVIREEPALVHSLPATDRFVAFGGGVPIEDAGQVVGAVGVSGGTVAQDAAVAEGAVKAVRRRRAAAARKAPTARKATAARNATTGRQRAATR